jgi:1,4-dihydroxy-2-naphthoate octaprenyltransferase
MFVLFGPMRPPFLILGPVCVFLGYACARWRMGDVSGWNFILALMGAVAAHISVNALNKYSDFKSGLDFKTRRTPFSGGSGTLPAHPEAARGTLWVGILGAGVVLAIGLYFIATGGMGILPLGLAGLALIVLYTNYITRSVFWCLMAPGLGFGVFMVMGSDFVLSGSYSLAGFIASLVPTFLVSNLLLLNQFPDVEADRSIGRKHLVVVSGLKGGAAVYILFLALAFLSLVAGVAAKAIPATCLVGLGTMVLAIPAALGALRHYDDPDRLIPAMRLNVLINLLTPALVGVGFLIG